MTMSTWKKGLGLGLFIIETRAFKTETDIKGLDSFSGLAWNEYVSAFHALKDLQHGRFLVD